MTATIGDASATVQFARPRAGFVGLTQVNLLVPAVAGGDQPLVVTIAGSVSNSAFVTVQP